MISFTVRPGRAHFSDDAAQRPVPVRLAWNALCALRLPVEAESLGQVGRFGPVGQGLCELAVDAELLQGGVPPTHRRADPVVVAGPAGWVGGLVVDQ